MARSLRPPIWGPRSLRPRPIPDSDRTTGGWVGAACGVRGCRVGMEAFRNLEKTRPSKRKKLQRHRTYRKAMSYFCLERSQTQTGPLHPTGGLFYCSHFRQKMHWLQTGGERGCTAVPSSFGMPKTAQPVPAPIGRAEGFSRGARPSWTSSSHTWPACARAGWTWSSTRAFRWRSLEQFRKT